MKNKKTIHNKEIYKEIQKRLDAEKHELIVPEASEEDLDRQKEMNKELETTKKTSKEIQDLQTEADDEDIKRAQDLNKELETTKKHADDLEKAGQDGSLAEKIAHKVKERLEEEEDLMKENISSDTKKYMLDKKLDFEGIKKLEKQMVEVSRILKDLQYHGGSPLSSKAAKAGNALGEVTYIFRQMLRDIDNDRLDKEFETGTYESKVREELSLEQKKVERFLKAIAKEFDYSIQDAANFVKSTISKMGLKETFKEQKTNNHSNPVNEAAKKKLVSLINNIALKEGISKKEATIRVVKSLKESKQ